MSADANVMQSAIDDDAVAIRSDVSTAIAISSARRTSNIWSFFRELCACRRELISSDPSTWHVRDADKCAIDTKVVNMNLIATLPAIFFVSILIIVLGAAGGMYCLPSAAFEICLRLQDFTKRRLQVFRKHFGSHKACYFCTGTR